MAMISPYARTPSSNGRRSGNGKGNTSAATTASPETRPPPPVHRGRPGTRPVHRGRPGTRPVRPCHVLSHPAPPPSWSPPSAPASRHQQHHRPADLERVRLHQPPPRVLAEEHIGRDLEQRRPRQRPRHLAQQPGEEVQRQQHPGEEQPGQRHDPHRAHPVHQPERRQRHQIAHREADHHAQEHRAEERHPGPRRTGQRQIEGERAEDHRHDAPAQQVERRPAQVPRQPPQLEVDGPVQIDGDVPRADPLHQFVLEAAAHHGAGHQEGLSEPDVGQRLGRVVPAEPRTRVPQGGVGVRHDETEDRVGEHPPRPSPSGRWRSAGIRPPRPPRRAAHRPLSPAAGYPDTKAREPSAASETAATEYPDGPPHRPGTRPRPEEGTRRHNRRFHDQTGTMGALTPPEESHPHERRATALGPPRPLGRGSRTAGRFRTGIREEGLKARRNAPRRTGWRRAIPTWRTALGTFLGLALLLGAAIFTAYQLVDIPAANAAATAQSNVYLYNDGSVIARDGDVNREKVKLSQVPPTVQHAVLAAEDRDFYSERAVDVKAMARAKLEHRDRQRQTGRLHHHPAVREELLPRPGTHPPAQGQGVHHRGQAQPRGHQGPDLRGLPQHQLLRTQRVRHPGRRPGVLRQERRGPHHLRRRLPRLPCSTPPAPTTSSPTPTTGPPPGTAGTTSWTAWSRRTGSPPPNGRGAASPPPARLGPPPGSPASAATSCRPSRTTWTSAASSTARPSPPAATASPPPSTRPSRTPSSKPSTPT